MDYTAAGANNGSSWENAYTSLAEAIVSAHDDTDIETIFVAEGTYYPEYIPPTESSTTDRDKTFYFLRDGLAVLGGYPNGGGTRDVADHPVILSGDIDEDGTDDAYHVVLIVGTVGVPLNETLVLDGLTFTAGRNASTDSPIDVNGSSVSNLGGAGLWASYSSPTISNCTISGNFGFNGVGIYNWYSSPVISNCIISGNSSTGGNGGGIYNYYSESAITNSVFSGNTSNTGGGMYNHSSSLLVIANCTFSGNTSAAGAGMYNNSSSPTITSCTFSGNNASSNGGGMFNFTSSSPKITNTIFLGNRAGTNGGGIYNSNLDGPSSPKITNTTFSGNHANNAGGVMASVSGSSSVVIANSIIWGNNSGLAGNTPTVTYSIVQGGHTGTGNKNENPLFVAPSTASTPFTDGDYRLLPDSPAIDAGNNESIPEGIDTDLDGNPRIFGSAVDMGTYEYDPVPPVASNKIYVDHTATGANDGSSWENAYTSLAEAIVSAHGDTDIETIFVAKGTYYPEYTPPTITTPTTDRDNSFYFLRDGLAVLGGYPNGGGTRDVADHPVILSGDIDEDGTDDAYHVVLIVGTVGVPLNETLVLDGLTFTAGRNASTDSPIDVNGSSVSNLGGAGLWASYSSPTISNCTISGNFGFNGVGIYNWYSSPVISNCIISGNSSSGSGGGIYNYFSTSAITNSVFSGNTSPSGAGMYNNSSSPVITNCTFAGNRANIFSGGGGGMYNESSSPVIANSIIWENSNGIEGSAATVTYSIVQGQDVYPGTANKNEDPLLVSIPSYADAPFTGGDYRLQPGSPAINTGNNDAIPEGATTDLAGNPRIFGSTVDMGAYEYTLIPPAVTNKIYVDHTATTGANNGADWVHAYVSLADAILYAHTDANVDTILVAEGTYYPKHMPPITSFPLPATTDRDKTFCFLRDGLAVLGGYPNGGGTRNHTAHPVVLSGDIGETGDNTDNVYHVVLAIGIPGDQLDNSLVFDGLTFTAGNADLINSPIFINNASIVRHFGGGLVNYRSSPTITNCTFSGNRAVNGGGIYNYLSSSPVITNSIFSGNRAITTGGGIYNWDNCSPTIRNCTFSGNNFGAIANTQSQSHISNSIIWGNGGEVDVNDNVTYSIIEGGHPGEGNLNSPPNFIEMLPRTDAPFTGGNYRLQFCSPAIDAGNNTDIAGITTDLDGNPRIIGSTVDMGAYEKQSDSNDFANNVALSTGNDNNLTFPPAACEQDGWTFYASPDNPDSFSFAIKWGTTNDAAKAAAKIYLHLDDDHTIASNGIDQALITMKRYWNVDLDGQTLTDPVSVRFYFDTDDTEEMLTLLNGLGVGEALELKWIKTIGALFDPATQLSYDNINNGDFILLTGTYGADNDVDYVQFDNLDSFSGGTAAIGTANTPLPVTLIGFRAQLDAGENQALVSWAVADESLTQYEVERSTDDARSFKPVGTLPATGKSNYAFRDPLRAVSANGNRVYYRLKMVEYDGGFNYSKIDYVRLPARGQTPFTLYPNPAREQLTLRNTDTALCGMPVQVTDASGRVIAQAELQDEVVIDLSGWASGLYFIKLPNGQVEKVIKE